MTLGHKCDLKAQTGWSRADLMAQWVDAWPVAIPMQEWLTLPESKQECKTYVNVLAKTWDLEEDVLSNRLHPGHFTTREYGSRDRAWVQPFCCWRYFSWKSLRSINLYIAQVLGGIFQLFKHHLNNNKWRVIMKLVQQSIYSGSTGFNLGFLSSFPYLIHGPRVFTIQNGSVNQLSTLRQIQTNSPSWGESH